MSKYIFSASLMVATLFSPLSVSAQKTSTEVPGLSYTSSTPGSTVTGSTITVSGNRAINTKVLGGTNIDSVGFRQDQHAQATINSVVIDASRITGSTISVIGNEAIDTLVSGKATAIINSVVIR